MAAQIDIKKYNKVKEMSFFLKKGKVVNVVGLTIESAGPDAKLGDLCIIKPEDEDGEMLKPIMAEVVGFRDKKTLLMPYDATDGIGLGSIVENTGYPLRVAVSDAFERLVVGDFEASIGGIAVIFVLANEVRV